MNSSNYRFTLDMQSRASQVSIPVLLNDTGRSLYINLRDGGDPYTIADGCLAVFIGKKRDETTLQNSCVIEKNSTIRYDFTEQTSNVAGLVNCEVRLYGADGRLITSPRFVMVVDSRVTFGDDEIVSEDEKTIFDTLVIELKEVIAAAREVLNNGGSESGSGSSGSARGISSIIKTGTDGLKDTYTIYYTDGTTSTYTVTNGADGDPGASGNGISEITKTATDGLFDTYTIAFTDGSTSTFIVTNGKDGVDGKDGASYTLTEDDKRSIVDSVLSNFTNASEVAM